MKNGIIGSTLMLVVAGMMNGPALADEHRQDRQRPHAAEEARAERAARIAEELGLTAEQREQVRVIMQESRQRAATIREEAMAERREMREQMLALRDETRERMNAVLTEEQRARMEAMRAEARERHEHRERRGNRQDDSRRP